MKNKISLILMFVVLATVLTFDQIADKDLEYLLVREDIVKPSRTSDYEASLTDLAEFLTDNKVKNANYIAQLQDNYHYSHVARLNGMGDINGGLRSYLKVRKIGGIRLHLVRSRRNYL